MVQYRRLNEIREEIEELEPMFTEKLLNLLCDYMNEKNEIKKEMKEEEKNKLEYRSAPRWM